MITYRTFRNYDPPQMLRLWHECGLGRGAAKGFTCDAFDLLVFSQPQFDPRGLILACEGSRAVGYIHAGFGWSETGSTISHDVGIISMLLVQPGRRGLGIGRDLVAKAEEYLRAEGAKILQAGEYPPLNPFYQGLYGGSQISGFLQSDTAAGPFFQKLGYAPYRKFGITQKDLTQKNEPVDFKLANIRRTMQLVASDKPPCLDPWWVTHVGHFEPVLFVLQPKAGGGPVAQVTCHGLDLFAAAWQRRAVGFSELCVPEAHRGKGYAKLLLLEILRRIRDETVTIAETHVPQDNPAATKLVEWLRFQPVDVGVVYRKA